MNTVAMFLLFIVFTSRVTVSLKSLYPTFLLRFKDLGFLTTFGDRPSVLGHIPLSYTGSRDAPPFPSRGFTAPLRVLEPIVSPRYTLCVRCETTRFSFTFVSSYTPIFRAFLTVVHNILEPHSYQEVVQSAPAPFVVYRCLKCKYPPDSDLSRSGPILPAPALLCRIL